MYCMVLLLKCGSLLDSIWYAPWSAHHQSLNKDHSPIFGVIIQTRVIIRLNKVFCIIICIMSWYGDIFYVVLLFKYGPLFDSIWYNLYQLTMKEHSGLSLGYNKSLFTFVQHYIKNTQRF